MRVSFQPSGRGFWFRAFAKLAILAPCRPSAPDTTRQAASRSPVTLSSSSILPPACAPEPRCRCRSCWRSSSCCTGSAHPSWDRMTLAFSTSSIVALDGVARLDFSVPSRWCFQKLRDACIAGTQEDALSVLVECVELPVIEAWRGLRQRGLRRASWGAARPSKRERIAFPVQRRVELVEDVAFVGDDAADIAPC